MSARTTAHLLIAGAGLVAAAMLVAADSLAPAMMVMIAATGAMLLLSAPRGRAAPATTTRRDRDASRRSEGLSRRDAALASLGGAALATFSSTAARAGSPGKLGAEDRLDLIDLHARYAWAYDCSDADAYVTTFTADGSLAVAGGEPRTGHAALREFAAGQFVRQKSEPPIQHHNGHFQFHPQPDGSVRVYCYWTMIQGADGEIGYRIRSTGFYDTLCVKQGDDWLIRQRTIHRWNKNRAPWS